jgi:hypothetical protein
MTVDELMALVEAYADARNHDDMGHFPEGASRPRRAALRSALEQVVADSERYAWLCTDPNASFFDFEGKCCRGEPKAEIDAAIDNARKASNANT